MHYKFILNQKIKSSCYEYEWNIKLKYAFKIYNYKLNYYLYVYFLLIPKNIVLREHIFNIYIYVH